MSELKRNRLEPYSRINFIERKKFKQNYISQKAKNAFTKANDALNHISIRYIRKI